MRTHTTVRGLGFTLFEVLVAVAITALLIALVLPVVSRVRQQARFSRGTSNLRQWNSAALLFAGDRNGWLPHQGFLRSDPILQARELQTVRGVPVWYNALPLYFGERTLQERATLGALPKLGDLSVWMCPAASDKVDANVPWLNYAPSVGLSDPGSGLLARLDKISDPSRTPLFCETTNNSAWRTLKTPPWFLNVVPATPATRPNAGLALENRWGGKRGRAAVGFCDGSVRAFSSDELKRQAAESQRPEGLRDGTEYTGGPVHWRVFR